MQASGVRTDGALFLHTAFQQAGLPAPNMRMQNVILGLQPGYTTCICDLLFSLLPKAQQNSVSKRSAFWKRFRLASTGKLLPQTPSLPGSLSSRFGL